MTAYDADDHSFPGRSQQLQTTPSVKSALEQLIVPRGLEEVLHATDSVASDVIAGTSSETAVSSVIDLPKSQSSEVLSDSLNADASSLSDLGNGKHIDSIQPAVTATRGRKRRLTSEQWYEHKRLSQAKYRNREDVKAHIKETRAKLSSERKARRPHSKSAS